jgi:nitrite reductase/ring-hydroxylating ferredoxin subunit
MSEDNFVLATEESDISEDSMKLVNIVGRSILLARHGAQIYGFSNKCPHMGCSLSNGKLKDFTVTCPCHSWEFDIRNGKYRFNNSITLMTYECKIQNEKIFVKMMDI